MHNKKLFSVLAVAIVAVFGLLQTSIAQEKAQGSKEETIAIPYRVDLSVYDLESGKRVNQRDYSLFLRSNREVILRNGTRVPITMGGDKGNQIQYIDVGLRVDCNLEQMGENVGLNLGMELSSFAMNESSIERAAGGNPVLRNVNQRVLTIIPLGKPIVVTSMDDINSNKRTQVEVTVTRLKY